MDVTLLTIGRFHHFHLARQLEKNGLLREIWSGFPKFKLKDETNIPLNKIKTFPWLQTPYMLKGHIGLGNVRWLDKQLSWASCNLLDSYVASQINFPTTLVASSACGLTSGKKVQKLGGKYICDRGSSHIRFQENILAEEYKRWNLKYFNINTKVIEKEEAEYEQADIITVPSEFVKNSFLQMGVSSTKIQKIVYGARLDRFHKVLSPEKNKFQILWVGAISIRKGFLDLLVAFDIFSHPNKELVVVGYLTADIKKLLLLYNINNVKFLGMIPNNNLPEIYSKANVFVLPSIEEGLANVQGEALACGCPVIATTNCGSEDLFTDGIEGFIVPIRSPKIIAERLQQLADDNLLRENMSVAALNKVKKLGGWDTYGNEFCRTLQMLKMK